MTDALVVEDFSAFERQISTAGACSHPVRLRGKVTAIDLATGEHHFRTICTQASCVWTQGRDTPNRQGWCSCL